MDQVERQPDAHHQLFALLARNGIADGALQIHTSQQTEANYRQQLNVPDAGLADLTVQAKLNDKSQYDIVGITLHVLSSGNTESIRLGAPAPALTSAAPQPMADRLAAQSSRGQLTQALIGQSAPHGFPPAPQSSAAGPSGPAVSHDAGVPAINDEPLYGVHTHGAEAEVRFLKEPPKEVAQMCKLAIDLIGKSFPPGFNHIDFDFYGRGNNSLRGVTTSDGNRSKVSIGLIPSDDWEDDYEMHGMIAFTAFHEAFLHALPDLRTASRGAPGTTEQQDHDIILMPPDETNALHQAVKAALPSIPEHIKQYFLDAYVDDVGEEKSTNDRADEQATEQWHQQLSAHLNNLDSDFWRG
ncbi:hypothetical protein [Pseudomonas typographi]|uniref:Uncharacterized protein n=1 Tax=Pseudomonas typographi TaxID=2715964 RepID=A0ABR7Z138_9PSED|nr:hypothetical protein [Pseudomonas typographi]MBD1599114.1 hypothetical protein [Pseudomonas typographi]